MSLIDIFFPKICLGCGFLGSYICLQCEKKLNFIRKDSCFYCGKSSLHGLTHPSCRKKNGIDGIVSIFYYNNFLKKIIKNIKYRLAKKLCYDLCRLIKPENLERLSFFKNKPDLFLQPVPLHASRLKERGFNQTEIVADYFSGVLNIPIVNWATRIKNTKYQAELKQKNDRQNNMKGAFSTNVFNGNTIQNKELIIIDDVVTTGCTALALTRELKIKGAAKVYLLTIAKG